MRKPLYCWFDIEPKLDHHTKQEVSEGAWEGGVASGHVCLQAVVLEGKYWKRKPEAVATEYRKWRFYKEKRVHSILLYFTKVMSHFVHYLVQVRNKDPALDEVREKAAAIFVSWGSLVS